VCPIAVPLLSIDMGVDLQAFHPGDAELAAHALGPAPDRPLVVQVGVKNAARLTEAVGIVRATRPGASLWLAGPGEPAAASRQPFVRPFGGVSPDVVPRLLRAADVVCLVSEREGYGLGVLEAMACGVPVVVSDAIPAAADVPPEAGVTVDPRSPVAIAAGIEAALKLERNSLEARDVARAHGADRQAERVLAVLERAVSPR
jgi:glycosyltransferase involved in cell wall biosynthesis